MGVKLLKTGIAISFLIIYFSLTPCVSECTEKKLCL